MTALGLPGIVPAMRWKVGVIVMAGVALLAGCASSTAAPAAGPDTTPTPSESNSAAVSGMYTSDGFAVPFTVIVSDLVTFEPHEPGPEQVTWESPIDPNDRIRFVAPVAVFPPGSETPIDPPADYASYLRGLAQYGAVIADEASIEVDGQTVPVFTITSTADLNGSIGCIANAGKDDNDCFGAHPDLYLRVAVIPVQGKTVLAWARSDPAAPNLELVASFEKMLQTAHFGS